MPIPSKGALITGTSANNTTALPVGDDGGYLYANSTVATGLSWWNGPTAWTKSTEQVVQCSGGGSGCLTLGIGGTAPTATAASASISCNFACYRQVGPKRWQVFYQFSKIATGGTTDGNGDQYRFALPAGVPNIDTTASGQGVFQDFCTTTSNTVDWNGCGFPCIDVMAGSYAAYGSFSMVHFAAQPWDATSFRVLAQADTATAGWVGPNWFAVAGASEMQWGWGIEYTSV